jgi:FMN phosphatase YigB (HAD superfamily)
MKKNQLIEQLQKIKGNPEIKMWNGLVDDFMDFDFVENILVKEREEHIRFGVEMQWKERNKTWEIPPDIQKELDAAVKNRLKNDEWEMPNEFVQTQEELDEWYGKNVKRIIFINAKNRGKKCWDRLGAIQY